MTMIPRIPDVFVLCALIVAGLLGLALLFTT